jgi:hypothetical protein
MAVGHENRTHQGPLSRPLTGFEDRAGHQIRRPYHSRLVPSPRRRVNLARSAQSSPRSHKSSSSSPTRCPTSCITVMPICSISSSRVFAKRSRFFWYSTIAAGK